MTFAEQLRSTRYHLQFTQAELAGALDEDPQSISNWECGRNEPWPRRQLAILSRLLELRNNGRVPRERVCDRI